MSRELICHDLIKNYTTIWMDSIRGGKFGLSSTNKLVYYYDGCTGLKTGFTSKAMYCLSATAERDGVEYIAVIMHGDSIEARNKDAMALLDYAFANYKLCTLKYPEVLPPVMVKLGTADSVQPVYGDCDPLLIEKSDANNISYSIELEDEMTAPVNEGDALGSLTVSIDGKVLRTVPLVAGNGVERKNVFGLFTDLLQRYIGMA